MADISLSHVQDPLSKALPFGLMQFFGILDKLSYNSIVYPRGVCYASIATAQESTRTSYAEYCTNRVCRKYPIAVELKNVV